MDLHVNLLHAMLTAISKSPKMRMLSYPSTLERRTSIAAKNTRWPPSLAYTTTLEFSPDTLLS